MAKRRSNGEGNIRKRKNGRWEERFTAGHDPITGKPITKNVLTRTQAECKKKLREELTKAEVLDYTKADKITVGAWMDTWFENYMKTTLRPATVKNYEILIRVHIKPVIGDIPLKQLTPTYLQQLYAALLTKGRVERPESQYQPKGLSVKTVRNIHTIIRSACEKAVAERLLMFNPAVGCKLPKKERKEMKILPLDQLQTFFAAAKEYGCYEMFYFELATGLRRGELFDLKWSDIDFGTGAIRIQRQAQRLDGKVQETKLKTSNAYRTILVDQDILEMLQDMKDKREIDSPYVFCSPTGGILEPGSQRKRLQRLLESCGMEKIRFHDLRHPFATVALEHGMDVKTLSTIIGHVSAATTLDVYSHMTDHMQQQAAVKIDRRIGKTDAPLPEEEAQQIEDQHSFQPYKPKYRKSGTGGVYQLNDHLWEGKYSPRDAHGKRVSCNVYAKTREECEVKLAAMIEEVKKKTAPLKQRKGFPMGNGYDRIGARGDTVKRLILILMALMLLSACGYNNKNNREDMYMSITAEEAKAIMDSEEGYIILDVRTQEEYDESHIPGAILMPNTEIEERAEEALTDKDQLILVYCRSGRRSKMAAEILVELGYTNIREFGGIIDWPYEVE